MSEGVYGSGVVYSDVSERDEVRLMDGIEDGESMVGEFHGFSTRETEELSHGNVGRERPRKKPPLLLDFVNWCSVDVAGAVGAKAP